MNRICKVCGAAAQQGERFCHCCGKELPTAMSQKAKRENAKKRGVLIAAVLLAAMVLCGSAWLGLRGADSISGTACALCPSEQTAVQPSSPAVSSTDDAVQEEDTTESTTTTTATTTTTTATTTTTTKKTTAATTTTTQNAKKAEAERIRKLLVSKKWKTTVEGYDANVEFKSNGTAVITVKIGVGFLSITEKVNAEYAIDDNCHAVIHAKYNNMNLGISGMISSSSNDKVVINRDANQGKVTLTAA